MIVVGFQSELWHGTSSAADVCEKLISQISSIPKEMSHCAANCPVNLLYDLGQRVIDLLQCPVTATGGNREGRNGRVCVWGGGAILLLAYQ